ncbi:DUF5325 family protein [Bacillus sp. 165]|uniref:DUF5325 family protein n=1 Tax=Bacillus sp. 165 TaxID=1529117 RepID=UPI001ADB54FD|nr:DUF5325 family protein [Bacillus sp. 165]MBO9130314.1 DUF5325 family protein [Bacillus sp. 165]
MENIQYRFLVIAMIGVLFMILIGIMIAEKSTIGVLLAIAGTLATIGYGFMTKRKLKNSQKTQ